MREPSVFSEETRVTTSRNLDRFPPIRDVMRSVAGAGDFTLLCSDLGEHRLFLQNRRSVRRTDARAIAFTAREIRSRHCVPRPAW